MNILVTVGTGAFNTLIDKVVQSEVLNKHDIFIQYGSSKPASVRCDNVKQSKFIANIANKYSSYEFVITHCGAGSVFNLLEKKINFIAIPNLERTDKHQLELANYLYSNKLASVCFSLSDLDDIFANYDSSTFNEYVKENFFLANKILNYIK